MLKVVAIFGNHARVQIFTTTVYGWKLLAIAIKRSILDFGMVSGFTVAENGIHLGLNLKFTVLSMAYLDGQYQNLERSSTE